MKKPTFKEHIEYLKDNPEGYWFKNKLYGLGWTPATREGWIVTIIFIGLVVFNAIRASASVVSEDQVLKSIILPTFALLILFLVIVWRTGEPLRWRWGLPKKNEERSQNN